MILWVPRPGHEVVMSENRRHSVRTDEGPHDPPRGKSPLMGTFPNLRLCIISYQKVRRCVLKNVNH